MAKYEYIFTNIFTIPYYHSVIESYLPVAYFGSLIKPNFPLEHVPLCHEPEVYSDVRGVCRIFKSGKRLKK